MGGETLKGVSDERTWGPVQSLACPATAVTLAPQHSPPGLRGSLTGLSALLHGFQKR